MTDELGEIEIVGMYTTVEYLPREAINVWGHPRDYRDAKAGREDVAPLNDPVTDAILERMSVNGEWLALSLNIDARAVNQRIPDDITVVVNSGE